MNLGEIDIFWHFLRAKSFNDQSRVAEDIEPLNIQLPRLTESLPQSQILGLVIGGESKSPSIGQVTDTGRIKEDASSPSLTGVPFRGPVKEETPLVES